jgi:transposase
VSRRDKDSKKRRRRERPAKPEVKHASAGELKAVIERARELGLSDEECAKLESAIETLEFVVGQLDSKTVTLTRLRSLFGLATSEKTRTVVGEAAKPAPTENSGHEGAGASTTESGVPPSEPVAGHGRNGVEDYAGAETIEVAHESLKGGEACPECERGKVYEQKHRPRVLLRVTGQPPVKATVVKLQTFRCNLCGKVFTARAPDALGDEKYDETAAAMIGLLKYGSGLPFNRLEWLERNMGIPLPASTQWEVVRDAAEELAPVHEELIRQAAQAEVLHNDDTSAKILSLVKENRSLKESGEAEAGARTGIFATGIVAVLGERRVALFFTGRKHAGENAEELLRHRAEELGPPIQMCDALDRNVPATAETLLANCLAHGRRRFVDSYESFPGECRHVLEVLRDVFGHEADAKTKEFSPELRLRHHQEHSAPLLDALHSWMESQLDDRLVEPNSSLGEALRYMLNHWEPLTLFLREPGAPLDNNICERALKKFILLRKNAYFYKTENGAAVGDAFMSLIHTAELNQVNPFEYLVALLRHADAVCANPAAWLPWNYTSAASAE